MTAHGLVTLISGHGLPEARMKPWGDALSGARVLLSQWLPRWLGGGPTCPTMAAMQSHLPYVTDYANAARRFGTVDVMVRIPSSVLRLASRYDLKNYSTHLLGRFRV